MIKEFILATSLIISLAGCGAQKPYDFQGSSAPYDGYHDGQYTQDQSDAD